MKFIHSVILLFLITTIAGCDQTFHPLQENSKAPFSMFGYLDASADTQVVRITPLQKQVDTPSEKPDMHVTLTHMENGTSATLKDSLVQFYLPGGYSAINSRTPMDLDFGQSYQLRAERPDGASSSVFITIPDDYPSPEVIWNDEIGCFITIVISGVERMADVQYQVRVRISRPGLRIERTLSAPYRDHIRQTDDQIYKVNIYLPNARKRASDELGSLPANTKLEVLERHIFIASGGPEWIDYDEVKSLDDLIYALPEVASNVENGVGYVIGIASKTIPDDTCPE